MHPNNIETQSVSNESIFLYATSLVTDVFWPFALSLNYAHTKKCVVLIEKLNHKARVAAS